MLTISEVDELFVGRAALDPEAFELAKSVVAAFLASEFIGGASTRKVDKLKALDRTLEAGLASADEPTA